MSSDDVSTTTDEKPSVRKSSKPLMEKKRRARFNSSVAQLKSLLVDTIESEGPSHSKMDKADILELTVRHLRHVQPGRHTPEKSTHGNPTQINRFRLGFSECINEVSYFLNALDPEKADLRVNLLDHLASCSTGHHANGSNSTKQNAFQMTPTSLDSGFKRIIAVSNDNKTSVNTSTVGAVINEQITSNVDIFDLTNNVTTQHNSVIGNTELRHVENEQSISSREIDGLAAKLPVSEAFPKQHINSSIDLKLNGTNFVQSTEGTVIRDNTLSTPVQPLQVPILTSTNTYNNLAPTPLCPIQITRLPNGELAFIVPANVLTPTVPITVNKEYSQPPPVILEESQSLGQTSSVSIHHKQLISTTPHLSMELNQSISKAPINFTEPNSRISVSGSSCMSWSSTQSLSDVESESPKERYTPSPKRVETKQCGERSISECRNPIEEIKGHCRVVKSPAHIPKRKVFFSNVKANESNNVTDAKGMTKSFAKRNPAEECSDLSVSRIQCNYFSKPNQSYHQSQDVRVGSFIKHMDSEEVTLQSARTQDNQSSHRYNQALNNTTYSELQNLTACQTYIQCEKPITTNPNIIYKSKVRVNHSKFNKRTVSCTAAYNDNSTEYDDNSKTYDIHGNAFDSKERPSMDTTDTTHTKQPYVHQDGNGCKNLYRVKLKLDKKDAYTPGVDLTFPIKRNNPDKETTCVNKITHSRLRMNPYSARDHNHNVVAANPVANDMDAEAVWRPW